MEHFRQLSETKVSLVTTFSPPTDRSAKVAPARTLTYREQDAIAFQHTSLFFFYRVILNFLLSDFAGNQ